jgi:hypothetical protein
MFKYSPLKQDYLLKIPCSIYASGYDFYIYTRITPITWGLPPTCLPASFPRHRPQDFIGLLPLEDCLKDRENLKISRGKPWVLHGFTVNLLGDIPIHTCIYIYGDFLWWINMYHWIANDFCRSLEENSENSHQPTNLRAMIENHWDIYANTPGIPTKILGISTNPRIYMP